MTRGAAAVVHVSARAADRIGAVVEALAALPPDEEILVVGPTREVADELARRVARARGGASFGLRRTTLHHLAEELAHTALARRGVAVCDGPQREGLVRRALADALAAGELEAAARPEGRAAIASPSFPRALAATLDELRLSGVSPAALRERATRLSVEAGGAHADRASWVRDLAVLAARFDDVRAAAGAVDRAEVLAAATRQLEARGIGAVLGLVDVPAPTAAEVALLRAALAAARRAFVAVPAADTAVLAAVSAVAPPARPATVSRRSHRNVQEAVSARGGGSRGERSLERVQEDLFSPDPRGGAADESVAWLSAPSESREAVEVARRILQAARRGVPFDAVAVVVRSREVHGVALETALERAGIPAWFEAGARRPHPAGRALLALCACRREGLSARRFAEYLSLGEAPPAEGASRWERLLREAAIIGGASRWERRLAGLAEEKQVRLAAAARDGDAGSAADGSSRDLLALEALRDFALPLVERLASLPEAAPAPAWAELLEGLARAALREPEPVLAALSPLRALGDVTPATLEEVEATLDPALRWLPLPRPPRRHGRVLVTTPEGMRGRSARVVIVPGLAERLFPRPIRDDPLLPDDDREGLPLARAADRSLAERLALALAVGAAEEELVVSYARSEPETGRQRVPSLFALEILRARDGRLPELRALVAEAAAAADARPGWQAPRIADRAIDEAEHDLATLGDLFEPDRVEPVAGRARHLLLRSAFLDRALRARFLRWERRPLGPWDGARIESERGRALLAAARLTARAHSPSGLQRFAVCPYRFFLESVVGLRRADEPEAIERLDPRTRGELHHEALARLAAALDAAGLAGLEDEAAIGEAVLLARRITREVGERARARFAPRVPRVFDDEIEEIAADVVGWVRLAAQERPFLPHRFDLAFGLPVGEHHDPRSRPEPARVGPFLLCGAIDSVERNAVTGQLRITDFKSGADELPAQLVVGRGEVLQPVLYALALEAHQDALATAGSVVASRLLFASARGGFRAREVPVGPAARGAGRSVLETIDAAIDRGVLPALPRKDACKACAFRSTCGPDEERRARDKGDRKDAEVLDQLRKLRGLA